MDTSLIALIKEFGVPTGSLIIAAVFIARAFRWLAPRVEGWIDRVIKAHEKMVSDTTETNRQNSAALQGLATTQAQQTTILAAQTTLLHRVESYIVKQEKVEHAPPPQHPGRAPRLHAIRPNA
jgi:hypothetical protein